MSSLEETLARMKGLYKYGKELNENNNISSHTLISHTVAANGKAYGVIKECNKYYIKEADASKELMAEAYNYIGGIARKKDYEYDSDANAHRHFMLKVNSINESYDAEVNISTLDPFKKNIVLAESTDKMKDEIARQRQIMYNVSMLMNESSEIGAARKNDVVKFDGKNPEAETGSKGDKATGSKEGKATLDKDPKFKTNGVDKKVGPFDQNTPNCADQLKEECEDGKCDWGSEGIGKGRDPKKIGWEMEHQQTVNEEEEDWASKGLPSTPGVGEADTDHNNGPFVKNVNEGEEDFDGEDVEDTDFDGENAEDVDDFGGEDNLDADDMDTDFDAGVEDVDDFSGEDDLDGEADFNDETDLDDEGDFDDEADFGDEDDFDDEADFDGGDDDIRARIDALQSEIDSLRAQLDGEGEDDITADFDDDADLDDEDDFGDEADFDDEDDFDDEADFDGEDDFDDEADFDDESELNGEDDFDDEESDFESNFNNVDDDEFDDESFEDDMDECGDGPCNMNMMESKNRKMNSIIESVVSRILAEDELHDFGKHPGYRKKPMELPTTGEDRNQWGRDWNDDSVHNEEPFGKEIGSSAPFTQLVDMVTKKVMSQLAGDAFKKGE